MITFEMQTAYLKKIGITQSPSTLCRDLDTLKKIVEGHVMTIPYDSLDLHNSRFKGDLNQCSNLSLPFLYRKMVKTHRGGRCIESGVLLQSMLKALGFKVTPLLCTVVMFPDFGRTAHCGALVTLENKTQYYVDTGVGRHGPFSPIELKAGEYAHFSNRYRLRDQPHGFTLDIQQEGKWTPMTEIPLTAATQRSYETFNTTNRDVHDPKSIFKHLFVLTKPYRNAQNERCRAQVFNNTFTRYQQGKLIDTIKIQSHTQLAEILQQEFKITLSPNDHFLFLGDQLGQGTRPLPPSSAFTPGLAATSQRPDQHACASVVQSPLKRSPS